MMSGLIGTLFVTHDGMSYAQPKTADDLSCQTLDWIRHVFTETRSIGAPDQNPALYTLFSGVDLRGVRVELDATLGDRNTKAVMDFLEASRPGPTRRFADLPSVRKMASTDISGLQCEPGQEPLQRPGLWAELPTQESVGKVYETVSQATGIRRSTVSTAAKSLTGFLTLAIAIFGTVLLFRLLRRKHRYLCDIQVRAELPGGSEAMQLINISETGCKLVGPAHPSERDPVTLVVGGKKLPGTVAWSTQSAFAIRFQTPLEDEAVRSLIGVADRTAPAAG